MQRFLTPTFKPVLQQIKLREYCLLLGWNYAGVIPYTGVTPLAAKQVCLGPVKRTTCTDSVPRSITTLHFLQQLFATCDNLIRCKIVLNVGGKTQHRFSTHFEAMLQNKLHILGARFTVWYLIKCILACCFHMITRNVHNEAKAFSF